MGQGDQRPSGRGAAPPTGFPEAFTNSFRGMLLGGLLGDVRNSGDNLLHSGPVMHQLCWTIDALIRHRLHTRTQEQGQGLVQTDQPFSPTSHIRNGLLHWGSLARGWPNTAMPEGWLGEVPALRVDRGPTQAEDSARADLVDERSLSRNDFRTSSALFRTLPIAASSVVAGPDVVAGWCATATGLTHGHPEAWSAAALMGVLVGSHLTEVFRSGPWARIDALTTINWFFSDMPEHPMAEMLRPGLTDAAWSPATLARLSPDDSTAAVLAGSLYLFEHFRDERPSAIRALAARAAAPHAVASLTSALIGLERGPGGLDSRELSRHELSWVLDALARDYCVTLWSPPAHHGEMDALAEMTLRYPEQA
ncbi:ADP-ribosylglycohydrolase family protein [Granulicoccus sp. GXG6511]|uniref:ADP-ribosylglycohydrolase family protein n=1 Tax=Granulicoccus sp. GXG6511 TaxID=3381351 RepID=UPI003D7F0061